MEEKVYLKYRESGTDNPMIDFGVGVETFSVYQLPQQRLEDFNPDHDEFGFFVLSTKLEQQ